MSVTKPVLSQHLPSDKIANQVKLTCRLQFVKKCAHCEWATSDFSVQLWHSYGVPQECFEFCTVNCSGKKGSSSAATIHRSSSFDAISSTYYLSGTWPRVGVPRGRSSSSTSEAISTAQPCQVCYCTCIVPASGVSCLEQLTYFLVPHHFYLVVYITRLTSSICYRI